MINHAGISLQPWIKIQLRITFLKCSDLLLYAQNIRVFMRKRVENYLFAKASKSDKLKSDIQDVGGVPQRIYKIPLKNYPDERFTGADPKN